MIGCRTPNKNPLALRWERELAGGAFYTTTSDILFGCILDGGVVDECAPIVHAVLNTKAKYVSERCAM